MVATVAPAGIHHPRRARAYLPTMVLVIAAVAVIAVVLAAVLVVPGALHPGASTTSDGPKLPSGADAAIWSILEAVPDPRNHLALTRDLTGEVRITGTPLDPAVRAAAAAASGATPTVYDVAKDEDDIDLPRLRPAPPASLLSEP